MSSDATTERKSKSTIGLASLFVNIIGVLLTLIIVQLTCTPGKPGVRIRLADRSVPEDTPLSAGERFRIEIFSPYDGYTYIVYRECTGVYRVLYPLHQDDNRIAQHESRILPETGWLKLDDEPGTEDVFVILGRKPVDWLEEEIERHRGPELLEIEPSRQLSRLLQGTAGPVRHLELHHVQNGRRAENEPPDSDILEPVT